MADDLLFDGLEEFDAVLSAAPPVFSDLEAFFDRHEWPELPLQDLQAQRAPSQELPEEEEPAERADSSEPEERANAENVDAPIEPQSSEKPPARKNAGPWPGLAWACLIAVGRAAGGREDRLLAATMRQLPFANDADWSRLARVVSDLCRIRATPTDLTKHWYQLTRDRRVVSQGLKWTAAFQRFAMRDGGAPAIPREIEAIVDGIEARRRLLGRTATRDPSSRRCLWSAANRRALVWAVLRLARLKGAATLGVPDEVALSARLLPDADRRRRFCAALEAHCWPDRVASPDLPLYTYEAVRTEWANLVRPQGRKTPVRRYGSLARATGMPADLPRRDAMYAEGPLRAVLDL